ncbi:hypothetical protein E2C01_027673 [Portunus trituberculatus]|uniref:Uncharacterized protein n=1 Tax=Portunus trituberculatus TaxID=210409 RepID=A0A5B7EM94_PORTR|nr:hypothetical protein [Portunus trituberculatus]
MDAARCVSREGKLNKKTFPAAPRQSRWRGRWVVVAGSAVISLWLSREKGGEGRGFRAEAATQAVAVQVVAYPAYCARAPLGNADQEGLTPPDACPDRRESDPLDSGHSSGDEACCVGAGVQGGGEVEAPGRGSNSSESSGKYSFRGSVSSLGEERHALHARTEDCFADTPVFEDEEEEEDGDADTEDSLKPLHGLNRGRKVSRGSVSSERGSFSSVTSVSILKARLGRSSSLTVPDDKCSCPEPCSGRGPRTVSLRLPCSYRGPDTDTNLPTIYVDDSPRQRCRGRRSSLRRALSLLSLPSLLRGDTAAGPVQAAAPPKQHKPVQKILRQPRRRHNTVRGISGLAIDGGTSGSGGAACPNLQRAHTLYYPTAATMRHATTARRARSVAT